MCSKLTIKWWSSKRGSHNSMGRVAVLTGMERVLRPDLGSTELQEDGILLNNTCSVDERRIGLVSLFESRGIGSQIDCAVRYECIEDGILH